MMALSAISPTNRQRWQDFQIWDINDNGWMVGGGTYWGESTGPQLHAVLLTPILEGGGGGEAPVPEPATLLLFGSGLAGLATRRRMRSHEATK